MKRLLSVLLAVCLIASLVPAAVAAGPEGYVTIAVEKFVLGQGYIKEPMRVPFNEGDTVYDVTARFVEEQWKTRAGYIQAFYDGAGEEESLDINPPEYIMNWNSRYFDLEDLIDTGRQYPGYLNENDYFDAWGMNAGASGWMITVNDVFIGTGSTDQAVINGDVIRWQYTLSMGLDIGCDMAVGFWGGEVFYTPENRDDLTGIVGRINAAANKDELLALPGAQEAYDDAYSVMCNLESESEEIASALAALVSAVGDNAGSAVSPDVATLTLPAEIGGAEKTEFNAVISVNNWVENEVNAIDGVVAIPDGVEVVSIDPAGALYGASLDFYLDQGVLRFAYISTDTLSGIEFSGESFPAELFTVKLRLTKTLGAYELLEFGLNRLRLIESSGEEAYQYDVSEAYGSVVVIPEADPVSASARVLYAGDGVDLIPEDKMAVAVQFVNLGGAPDVSLFGQAFYLSSELTDKAGVTGAATYVGLLDADVTTEELNNAANYTFASDEAETLLFADTNEDELINAEDALNVLSAWLRKTEPSGGKDILAMNVTADERIDTVDVLSIVEFYVNAVEFAVVGR